MKNTFSKYLIILLAIALHACTRHDLPEQEIPEPDFRATGTLDGQPFSLEAGLSGLELQSEYGASDIGQFVFQSSFVDPACSGCTPKLVVRLNSDHNFVPGQSLDVSDVFQPQTYPLQLQASTINMNSIQFFPEISDPLATYFWDFGDANTSTDMAPIHQYDSAGDYVVTLNVLSLVPPCSDMMTQTIHVGDVCSLNFNYFINSAPVNGDLYEISPVMSSDGLDFISWSVAINNQPAVPYTQTDFLLTIPSDGFADITLIYGNGSCTGSRTRRIPGSSYTGSFCLANFLMFPGDLMTTDKFCIIEYTDENGNLYTSEFAGNAGMGNQFDILSSSPYAQSINGYPAQSVTSAFSCYLVNVNDSADIKHFENVNATFAFVHP
jgi:PKD repeat protein